MRTCSACQLLRFFQDYEGVMYQVVLLCTLRVCVPKPWNMVLNKGSWDPKPRFTNIKGTNLKSLNVGIKKGLREDVGAKCEAWFWGLR